MVVSRGCGEARHACNAEILTDVRLVVSLGHLPILLTMRCRADAEESEDVLWNLTL